MHEQEEQRECEEIWEGPWGQYLLSFEESRVSIVVAVGAPPAAGPVLVLGFVIAPAVVFVVVVVADAAVRGHSGQSPLQVVVVGIRLAFVALDARGRNSEALSEVASVVAGAGTRIVALAQ